MSATPISPSQLYDLAIANGVNPSSLTTTSLAWQTAVDAVTGTWVNGLSAGYQVVKSSTDDGSAVETDIVGNKIGPQATITVDRSTQSLTVTQLDPATGKPLIDPITHTPFHETFKEFGPHLAQTQLSGNLLSVSGVVPTSSYLGGAGYEIPFVETKTNGIFDVADGNLVPNVDVWVNDTGIGMGPGAMVDTPQAPGEQGPDIVSLV
jgi:hypothetical protein